MTKEKFQAYLIVQRSGITNMFAVNKVIQLAEEVADTELTKEDCFDIMKNYTKYKEEYKLQEV